MDLTVAYLRLGDYYYYGKHPDGIDYQKAFGFYKSATWYNNSLDFQAQAYLSLGYMYQFGKGCEKNLEKARECYRIVRGFFLTNFKASDMGGKLSYISIFSNIFMELDSILSMDWTIFSNFTKFTSHVEETSFRILSTLSDPTNFSRWLLGIALFLVLTARAKLLNQKYNLTLRIHEIKNKTG